MEEIKCTIEHPLLVMEMDNVDFRKSFYERNKKLVWKKAGDIKIGDHILTPKNINVTNTISSINLNDYISSTNIISRRRISLVSERFSFSCKDGKRARSIRFQ